MIRQTKPIFILSLICIFVTGSVFFQSCEEESVELNKNEKILTIYDDLNDPRTLSNVNNAAIYAKATKRMKEHLEIKNDKMAWDVKKGADLNVSENIFNYMIENYNEINDLIEADKAHVYRNQIGQLRFIRRKETKSALPFPSNRLKSGPGEGDDDKIDFSGMSEREKFDACANFTEGGNYGNLADHFDLNSIDFEENGGFAHAHGTVYIDGKRCDWAINDGCYFQDNDDCWANEINYSFAQDYPAYYSKYTKSVDGYHLVEVRYYK